MYRRYLAKIGAMIIATMLLSGCGGVGGSGGGGGSGKQSSSTLGGTIHLNLINALPGGMPAGLQLSDGTETLDVGAGATSFAFSTGLSSGNDYTVTVAASPAGLTCTPTSNTGTMGSANVTSVLVTCSDQTYTISGTVTGLTQGQLVLANGNDTQTLGVGASTVNFSAPVPYGSPYDVVVQGQSLAQCTIANGAGTMGAGNVTNVAVVCSVPQMTVLAGQIGGTGYANNGVNPRMARFFAPWGVAADSSGNIYVSDYGDFVIRKISASGVVSTLAGIAGNSVGHADGLGTSASFNNPAGVAVDSAGNIYVADEFNSTIRKITPAGMVSTLAGTALVTGSTDATGAAARFNLPMGVATDNVGNIYVADTKNNTVRKISPGGSVSTLAGTAGVTGSADGTGPAASFNGPFNLTVDAAGNVYIADTGNNVIRKITPAGAVSTIAGTAGITGSADGTGAAARFNSPIGLTVDSLGNIYAGDTGNNVIRKITSAGVVTTIAGRAGVNGYEDGNGTAATFSTPASIAMNGSGVIIVADAFNNTVRAISAGGVVSTVAGAPGRRGSADGIGTTATFNFPTGVAVDGAGNVYVSDPGYNKGGGSLLPPGNVIRKITPTGTVTTLAGTSGVTGSANGTGAAASFYNPQGLTIDSQGNVYVADTNNSTIRKITPAGMVSTFAGSAGVTGTTDTSGGSPLFNNPSSVVADSADNIFVADSNNFSIRKITPAGVVTTFVSRLATSPMGITIDTAGNLYVGGISVVLVISPTAVVSTRAGTVGVYGAVDGTGASASFQYASGIAVDTTGNAYVADTYNQTIRKITPTGVVTTIVGAVPYQGFNPGGLPGTLNWPTSVAIRNTSGGAWDMIICVQEEDAIAEIINANAYFY